jgi:hypothetical protein
VLFITYFLFDFLAFKAIAAITMGFTVMLKIFFSNDSL